MDHYPEVNVSERECPREDWSSSRHDSASSINKAIIQTSPETKSDKSDSPPHYESFPPLSEQEKKQPEATHHEVEDEDDSDQDPIVSEMQKKAYALMEEYAQYLDASPPYPKLQLEGKTEEEKMILRMQNYSRGMSQIMGRQLVRCMRDQGRKKKSY
jgi:hypothetical protein